MDTQKLIDEACPTISDAGWSYYFVPATAARGERLGLDLFQFYFLGRGGVLGDVDATVVQSAFGYFNPGLLTAMWDAARAKVAPREAAREYFAAAHDHGRERLTGADALDGFLSAAAKVIAAGRANVAGLTLFAGAAAEPVPDDAPAAAMHQVAVLRELRGSAHLLANVAEGVDPKVAHFARRPEMFEAFGWSKDDAPEVTDADRAAIAAADVRTDRLVAPAYAALDDDEAMALLHGLSVLGPKLASGPIPGV